MKKPTKFLSPNPHQGISRQPVKIFSCGFFSKCAHRQALAKVVNRVHKFLLILKILSENFFLPFFG